MQINVVGAGIAGSIATALLRLRGHEVTVFDDQDECSASQASSNLYIRHWLKRFLQSDADHGVQVLEALYKGLIDEPFASGMGYCMDVHHIAQRHILVRPDVLKRVDAVTDEGAIVGDHVYPGRTVVCTGYRAKELVSGYEVYAKVGHCCLFDGVLRPGQSRLAIISPYKHEKLYQFDPETVYYADSVAVHLETYEERGKALLEQTMTRAKRHVGDMELRDVMVGYRPFVEGHDFGILHRHSQNVWSINGGGKNGLAAYAGLADKLVVRLLEEQ